MELWQSLCHELYCCVLNEEHRNWKKVLCYFFFSPTLYFSCQIPVEQLRLMIYQMYLFVKLKVMVWPSAHLEGDKNTAGRRRSEHVAVAAVSRGSNHSLREIIKSWFPKRFFAALIPRKWSKLNNWLFTILEFHWQVTGNKSEENSTSRGTVHFQFCSIKWGGNHLVCILHEFRKKNYIFISELERVNMCGCQIWAFASNPLDKVVQGLGLCFRHFNNWDERGPEASQKAVGGLHLRSAGEI